MKLTVALLPLLLIAPVASPRPQLHSDEANKASISGKVVDSKGVPVADAHVYAIGPSWGGPVPGAVTGLDGSFHIKWQPFGKGVVSASKVEAGFPDARMALYNGWTYASIAQIDATPGANIQVNLQFSEPDALIEWQVMSKADQAAIPRATYRIEWSDDPKMFWSGSIQGDGSLRFVLPKHPVLVRIQVPGFTDWISTDNAAFGGPLLLKPGTIDRRIILLDHK